ncbi:MAG: TonB-dependent receptor [Acidobacteria bacterium]|nr:TonB-dependent receptor [Acidobacteriota bacterium]
MPARLRSNLIVCILVCALLAANLLPGAVAATLSGTITDPTGGRVSGATVNLFTSAALVRTTESTVDGAFSFASLPAGMYLVEFSAEGFQRQSRRVRLEDPPEVLNVRLEIGGLHQQVSVVASHRPEVPTEIAKSVSLISSEEIANRAAVFLSDALSAVPALQIQQLGGPGHLASYRFRGLRPEDSAIFLDGFRFQDAADNRRSARPFLSDLLLTGADRIEVLRGAGSTLYGSNAIGGLINVISLQPVRPLAGRVSIEGGSLGLVQGTAGIEGRSRRASYGLDLAHVNYTRGADASDDYRITGGTARSSFQMTPQWSLFTKFSMNDSFALLNQDPSPLPNLPPLPAEQFVHPAIPFPHSGATFYPQLDDPDYRQTNRIVLGAVRADHQANSVWSQSFGFQSLRTKRFYDDGPGLSALAASLGYDQLFTTGPRRYDGGMEELFWRNTFAIRSFDSLQLHLDWERVALDQTEFGQTTEAEQKSFSIHLQNQLQLLDGRLHVSLAGGAQYYGLDPPVFSDSTGNPYRSASSIDVPSSYNGDAAVAYFMASSNTKLRVHAGNGFRSPSLYERFGSGGSGFYYGNPELKPERSIFIDGGFDQFFLGDKMQASATYFFTRLQTIIDFNSTPQDPFGRSFGYLNSGGGLARGVELSVSARPNALLHFAASYAFTNSDQPTATAARTTRVLGLADQQFTLGINLIPTPRLNLQLQTYAVSDHDFPLFGALFPFPFGTFRFPGYLRADLTASYLLRDGERARLRLLVRVDNLLNREYYHGGFAAPKTSLRAGLRWEF